MADLKTLGTFAIIVGCFAVIYPRFLHPMVLKAFGVQVQTSKDDDSGPAPGDRRPPPMPNDPKDIRHHMRPGPHPGMRAAAEMQKQQAQGSGRGMMGIVLPMYAIGICVYLIYTLFKVFNKKGKYGDPYGRSQYGQREGDGRVDRLGFPQRMQGSKGPRGEQEEVQAFLQHRQQQKDLEDLLVKMDDVRSVPEDEMRALQKRLEETEAQMTRILQAMQTMQARTATVAAESAGVTTTDNSSSSAGKVETVGASDEGTQEAAAKTSSGEQSARSSPDTESSYEVVKNSPTDAQDASTGSEKSSPSPFEHVEGNEIADNSEVPTGEGAQEREESEEILLDRKKEEEEEKSNVRHRKSGHTEDD